MENRVLITRKFSYFSGEFGKRILRPLLDTLPYPPVMQLKSLRIDT